jgi:hypothetical protein
MYADINPYAVTAIAIAKDVAKQYGGSTELATRAASLNATLSNVTTLDELLTALLILETLVGDSITSEVRQYDLDKPIRDQQDRSTSLTDQSGVLFAAYHRTISEPVVMEAVTASLGGAAQQIAVAIQSWVKPDPDWAVDDAKTDADCAKVELEFANAARQLVLLCLAAGARRPVGAELLTRLVASKAVITVQPRYKVEPGSLLLALSPALSASCASADPTAPDSLTRISKIVVSADDGDRAGSSFDAPVWLNTGTPSAADLARQSFTPGPGGLTVERALRAVLAGSLSFDTGYRPFYTPPRIEVLHEIVHAIHNANGENRKDIPLTGPDTALWDDAEEYWTIAHDPIGENALANDIGLPARQGHAGLYLSDLSPTSTSSKHSLTTISRKVVDTQQLGKKGDKSTCNVS